MNDAEVRDREIELLLEALVRRYGFDFRTYAAASIKRRINWYVAREKLSSISALQERVLRDPSAMQHLVAHLSVNVSSMFRDPEFYVALREHVVPVLRTYPFTRVWVAGCAGGEEVYSLAILLIEEGLYERSLIYATDISGEVLTAAKAGVFPLDKMREHADNYRSAGGTRDFSEYYVADHDKAMFGKSLKKNVVFSQHNLVSDGSFNEFHLILCRNVMIYFNRELREQVFSLLDDSLVTFGMLGLGAKESLKFTSLADQYEELVPGTRLYRRTR